MQATDGGVHCVHPNTEDTLFPPMCMLWKPMCMLWKHQRDRAPRLRRLRRLRRTAAQ